MCEQRFYRSWVKSGDLKNFEVKIFETDLLISASKDLKKEAERIVYKYRRDLLDYIDKNKQFKESFAPVKMDRKAPKIAQDMIKKSAMAGVGPMAGVAGALAEYTGRELLKSCRQVIVENGGDIFINSAKDRTMAVYAGGSPLSGKIRIQLSAADMPLGIAASSATVGPSVSLGSTDATVVISRNAVLSDCVATGAGNLVKTPEDFKKAVDYARTVGGILGVLIIAGDKLATWGKIKLI